MLIKLTQNVLTSERYRLAPRPRPHPLAQEAALAPAQAAALASWARPRPFCQRDPGGAPASDASPPTRRGL